MTNRGYLQQMQKMWPREPISLDPEQIKKILLGLSEGSAQETGVAPDEVPIGKAIDLTVAFENGWFAAMAGFSLAYKILPLEPQDYVIGPFGSEFLVAALAQQYRCNQRIIVPHTVSLLPAARRIPEGSQVQLVIPRLDDVGIRDTVNIVEARITDLKEAVALFNGEEKIQFRTELCTIIGRGCTEIAGFQVKSLLEL